MRHPLPQDECSGCWIYGTAHLAPTGAPQTAESVSDKPTDFEKFCTTEAIKVTILALHNYCQNPLPEGGIRVLQDAAIATSIQVGTPSVFWDALLTAIAHVTDRTSISTLPSGMTPYLTLSRQSVSIAVWGSIRSSKGTASVQKPGKVGDVDAGVQE